MTVFILWRLRLWMIRLNKQTAISSIIKWWTLKSFILILVFMYVCDFMYLLSISLCNPWHWTFWFDFCFKVMNCLGAVFSNIANLVCPINQVKSVFFKVSYHRYLLKRAFLCSAVNSPSPNTNVHGQKWCLQLYLHLYNIYCSNTEWNELKFGIKCARYNWFKYRLNLTSMIDSISR